MSPEQLSHAVRVALGLCCVAGAAGSVLLAAQPDPHAALLSISASAWLYFYIRRADQ
jgi:hypothetical protein